jgi:hypothetical protein
MTGIIRGCFRGGSCRSFRTVEVGRPYAALVAAVLTVVTFAEFDSGDFANGVRLIS